MKKIIIFISAVLLVFGAPAAVALSPKRDTRPAVALTFDDGPSDKTTPIVLEALKKHGAKATFFMLGEMVKKNPETARAVSDAGHEIGNHTYSHRNLKTLSDEKIKEEIDKTASAVKEATGMTVFTARAPGGSVNDRVKAALSGYDVVGWTVDTKDWKYRSKKRLIEYIKTVPLKDGDIILMHDIHLSTAEALDEVLSILEERGFRTVTVSELFARSG